MRSGSWSRKIEVAKSSKGHEININLISSEYGKPWEVPVNRTVLTVYVEKLLEHRIVPLTSFYKM